MAAPRKPVAKSASAKPVFEAPAPAPMAAKFTPPAETLSVEVPEFVPETVAATEKLMEDAAAAVARAPADVAPALAPVMAPIGELQEMFRAAIESNIEQSKAAYARLKSSAEEATNTIETAYKTASAGSIELNNKAIDLMRDNTNALFDFAKSLTAAKSLSDVVVLQTEHARKQFEAFSSQAKEFSGLVQKVATESAGPLNAVVAKGMRVAA